MPEDDTIGQIIRRDLDRLPMLPADRWVPRTMPQKTHLPLSLFASTAAIALSLVLALGIGQGLRALREGSSAPLNPSRDETFILANPTGLLVLDAQGQTVRHVVDLPPQSQPSTPALNSSRTALAFTLTQIPGATGFGSDIYTVNVDGTGLRALVSHEADNVFYAGPVFDPSGSFLYFYRRAALIVKGSFTGNDDTIQRLDLRTGERRTIISSGTDPTISSDGRVLVYVKPAGPGTTNALWRANADGTNAAPFFAAGSEFAAQLFLVQPPRVAPSGCEVAFAGLTQTSGPGGEMLLAPCDGSSLRSLGSTSQHGVPAWSLDGSQLAYVSEGKLYLVEVKTGATRTVGFGDQNFTFGDVAWLRTTPVEDRPVTSPKPSPSSSPAREAILQRFSRTSSEIRRVDRIDAKLMTRAEFERVANTGSSSPNVDPNQLIWVVAISGDVVPQFSRGQAFTWGIYLVSADSGDILGMLAGGSSWPPYFDGLPSREAIAPIGDDSARRVCQGKLGTTRLVAAFESTAKEVADWVENVAYPNAPHALYPEGGWRALPPSAPAYVCYFDGQFNPPGGPVPGASVPPLVGRALILLDASGTQLGPSKYGPSSAIPLNRPGTGPF